MHAIIVIAETNLSDPQLWINLGSLLLSALTILVTIVLAARGQQRKILAYEIASNSSVINEQKDVALSNVSLTLNGRTVTNVRVLVVKLTNAGNTAITPQDYPDNPSLEFVSPPYPQPLVSCEVQDTGVGARLSLEQLKKMLLIDNTGRQSVILRPPLLNPRDALFLRILLRADNRESVTLHVRGQIKDGELQKDAPPQRSLTRRAIIIGICMAFVLGTLMASFSLIITYVRGSCAVGSIQVVGSTSFKSTVQNEQTNYNAICPSVLSNVTISDANASSAARARMPWQMEKRKLQIPSCLILV
jgi:hypothetical protein